MKLKNKSLFKYSGKVIDLCVENSHTYNAEGLAVHNSGGGSLVNYVLGITQLDPLKYDLIFERFMSPSRKDVPDIDCITFDHKVVLGNHSLKMIGELQVGDFVLDHDGTKRAVLAVKKRESTKEDIIFKLDFELLDNKFGNIVCTSKHRLIMYDGAEKMVGDINVGDIVAPNATVISKQIVKEQLSLVDITVEESSKFRVIPFSNNVIDELIECDYIVSHNSDISDRDAVIDAMKKEFGDDAVVPIANWSTLQLKSLVKDVSKFYGLDFERVNEMTKKLDDEVKPFAIAAGENKSLFQLKFDDCMEHSPAFKEFMEENPQIAEHVKVLHQQIKTCFDADALVATDNGEKKPLSLTRDDRVAYVAKDGSIQYNGEYEVIRKGLRDVYEIELEDGTKLKLTGDHKMKTNRGWLRADELTADDEVVKW